MEHMEHTRIRTRKASSRLIFAWTDRRQTRTLNTGMGTIMDMDMNTIMNMGMGMKVAINMEMEGEHRHGHESEREREHEHEQDTEWKWISSNVWEGRRSSNPDRRGSPLLKPYN